ncbi:caspase family protein [Mesorhizobium sp. BAC0120]|uniref:caspase family protein n=1 Tax=Mesorhizobium sp. BAC0120 TaxID=3090670 RepID=UPI00298CFAC1|nr:caspase family protein [Mesorhizobium sp. BAC0120]MDW6025434.1 caspase family protein [Mesorhizobium sp. BAC0120]
MRRDVPRVRFILPGERMLVALLVVIASLLLLQDSAFASLNITGRRTALVIGNSEYQALPKLPNAVNDANRVKEVLQRANFDVVVGENLDGKGLEKTIRDFLRSLNDGDIALFYYSGHAAQVAGENYIFPVDASLASSYDLEVQAYNVGNLLDYMRQSSSLQIAILDACRDNPFRNGVYYVGKKKVDVAGNQGLAAPMPGLGSLIVYSTAPDQVAYDGGGSVSPFTGAFAKNALTPGTEVRELITRIRNEVISETGGRQVPWDVSSLTTSFYFVKNQNLLVVQNTTDVRIPSTVMAKAALKIPMPLGSGNAPLSVQFAQLPDRGTLWIGNEKIDQSSAISAEQLSQVAFEPDPADRSPQHVKYVVSTDDGRTASGEVNIAFEAAPESDKAAPAVAQSNSDKKPVQMAMAVDVGTGFANLPGAQLSDAQADTGWLRLADHDPGVLVALNDKVVSSGDLFRTADVRHLVIRPSLAAAGEKLAVNLVPATADGNTKPVAITVAAAVNKCDELAAEPFDIQGVTEGVLPNEIDVQAAGEACKQAVAQYPDVARFKYQYGRGLYAKGDFDGAVEQFKSAYDQGHVRAGYMLGRFYQLGVGVERDPAKAVTYFEAGTKKGDPYAQYSLAKTLIQGNGIAVDVDRGMKLLMSAAESGHTYALNQLGFEYRNGKNIGQDLPRAVSFFQKSTNRGDVWGMVNLGILYRDGQGVDKNTGKALDLFKQAEKGGQPEAGTLIGQLLLDTGNASPDEVLGWYRKSAELGQAWCAVTAADFIAAHPDLAKDSGEGIRYYALAASQNTGDVSKTARAALAHLSDKAIASEVQATLARMGHDTGRINGKLGSSTRKAAVAVLGAGAPKDSRELLVQLVRKEWITSRPRLDML